MMKLSTNINEFTLTKLNIQFVTNAKGIKQAVLIPIKEWLALQKEIKKVKKYTNFYKGIEESVREVYEIEKGNIKGQTLSEFVDEC